MRNFEQFNENNSSDDNNNISKVILINSFDLESKGILSQEMKKGLTPFYLNSNYEFDEILIDKSGFPYTISNIPKRNRYGRPITKEQKISLKYKKNPWGKIYLMIPGDIDDLKPMMNSIRTTLGKIEEQKTMLIDLIGSKLTHK